MGASTLTYLFYCVVKLHVEMYILSGEKLLQMPCMHS